MKTLTLFLLAATLLYSDPLPSEGPPPSPVPVSRSLEERTFFPYVGVGANGIGPIVFMPDVAIGCRKVNSQHVWDVNGGTVLPLESLWDSSWDIVYYGQISYLYFPVPSSGFYWGAGLTGGYSPFGFSFDSMRYVPYISLPFTIGKQFIKNNTYQFFQFQLSAPFCTGTLSYGIGF